MAPMSEDEKRVERVERLKRRKATLTPKAVDWVCREVADQGFFAEDLLVREGVSKATARRWLRRGEELLQEAETPLAGSEDELCLALVAGVHYAEATVINKWQRAWTAACEVAVSQGKPGGAAAWEKRISLRFPDKFRKVDGRVVVESSEDVFAKLQASESSSSVPSRGSGD